MRNTPWLLLLACTMACGDKEPDDEPERDDSAAEKDSTEDSEPDDTEDSTEDSEPDDTEDSTDEDSDGDGVPAALDCDDADPTTFPGAAEACDGADNNCDGAVDEGVTLVVFVDEDGDGFGDDTLVTAACEATAGLAEVGGDCDDGDSLVNPDGTELCDTIDNDCDGDVDEDLLLPHYADADGDGHGELTAIALVCPGAPGYSAVPGDCDDADPTSHPAATERCDGADNNCDGQTDEGLTATLYDDDDGDGYGDLDTAATRCADAAGYVAVEGDCDDTDPTISPAAAEVCSAVDLNCDGDNDERALCEDCEDGLDNDSDGLMDCEDADCSADAACIEDCGDKLDNDADGALDCWDDECWSSCGVVVRSHLERGAAELYTSSVYWSSGASESSWGVGFSLEGQVTVSVASEVFICDWTIDEARFQRRTSSGSPWSSSPTTSFNQTYEAQLSSGCGMDWETVVPPDLSVSAARTAVSPWGVWYIGTISATRSTRGGFDHGFTVSRSQRDAIDTLDPTTVTWSY
ncbi:MAG: putative metal-binding motif-containing protein [Deltaproteobacteria bacterium]|nr:putative metal-binding motif-containing protein [Deltaproteobacteria bacterium]